MVFVIEMADSRVTRGALPDSRWWLADRVPVRVPGGSQSAGFYSGGLWYSRSAAAVLLAGALAGSLQRLGVRLSAVRGRPGGHAVWRVLRDCFHLAFVFGLVVFFQQKAAAEET